MENLWVDIERGYLAHGKDIFPAEFTITEMDTLCYKGQYYQITNQTLCDFRKLVPINQHLDDFDLGPQCEEYYIEE